MELYYDAHPPSFVPNKTDYNIGDLDMNGLKWYFERYQTKEGSGDIQNISCQFLH